MRIEICKHYGKKINLLLYIILPYIYSCLNMYSKTIIDDIVNENMGLYFFSPLIYGLLNGVFLSLVLIMSRILFVQYKHGLLFSLLGLFIYVIFYVWYVLFIVGVDNVFSLFAGIDTPLYYDIQIIFAAIILVIIEYFIEFKRGKFKNTIKKEL